MGPEVKMALAPIWCILRRKFYPATLDFRPAPGSVPVEHKEHYDATEWPVCPTDPTMRRIESDFWCMAVGNLPEAGGNMAATPFARQDDGALDILIVCRKLAPRLSRYRCVKLMLAMEKGVHVAAPEVAVIKTTKLRLDPRGAGHLQLSGQEQPMSKAVELTVLPKCALFLM
eukprot:FR742872.1.p1 GENE.FR742872.1~~FR742872.1.p1  ORF type:complete len:193 (+),score=14.37 FR742872.1:66-581(+)